MKPRDPPGYKKKTIGFKHRFEVRAFDEKDISSEVGLTKSRSEVYTAVKNKRRRRK